MSAILKFPILFFSFFVFLIGMLGCQDDLGAGTRAPELSLPDLSGNIISLKQFRGKVVLLDFWATWCPPCRKSIPELTKLQNKHNGDGLVIIGVSMDNPMSMSDEALRQFKKQAGVNYKILRADVNVVADYFGEQRIALPTMFVIDRDGFIRDKITGLNTLALKGALASVLP